MTRRAGKIALVGISLTLTAVLIEVGSRALGDVNYRWTPGELSNRIGRTIEAAQVHQRSPHAALPYELRPEVDRIWLGVGLRTNSAGMRDDEVSLEKPPGVRRIVVLGDSFAFGWKVPVEQTFSEQLEGRLNRKAGEGGPRFEVLNMGVVGYAMRDQAVVLRDKAMAWSPDVVVIAYVLNDPETDRVWLHNVFQEPEWWQYSSFLRRAALTVRNREIERVGDGSYYRYLHRDPAKWSSVLQAFAEMGTLAREADVGLVLAIFPMIRVDAWDEYDLGDLHTQVAEAGRKAGMHVIDLLPAYSRLEINQIRMGGDPHPSQKAHRLAARILERRLRGDHPALFAGP